jgi:hypothetical protein
VVTRRRWREATVRRDGERRTAAGEEESVSAAVASIGEDGAFCGGEASNDDEDKSVQRK